MREREGRSQLKGASDKGRVWAHREKLGLGEGNCLTEREKQNKYDRDKRGAREDLLFFFSISYAL